MITKSNIDLRTVNPKGRLDVLAYNVSQKLVSENFPELPGLWDGIQGDVQQILISGLSGITLPPEAMIMLRLAQMKLSENKGGQGGQDRDKNTTNSV